MRIYKVKGFDKLKEIDNSYQWIRDFAVMTLTKIESDTK